MYISYHEKKIVEHSWNKKKLIDNNVGTEFNICITISLELDPEGERLREKVDVFGGKYYFNQSGEVVTKQWDKE